jgi:hypothetical protein
VDGFDRTAIVIDGLDFGVALDDHHLVMARQMAEFGTHQVENLRVHRSAGINEEQCRFVLK